MTAYLHHSNYQEFKTKKESEGMGRKRGMYYNTTYAG